jgi:hypothetical protein
MLAKGQGRVCPERVAGKFKGFNVRGEGGKRGALSHIYCATFCDVLLISDFKTRT